MATDNPVESLQEEATCPICLEYFKDPVTIDCGHNFCRACIAQCWEGSNTDVSCPQCRETVQQRNLRPNRKLANIVEIAKRLSLQAAKGAGEERVCGEHQETLKLFCEEDQTSVCVVCHLSRAHRDHRVVPIEEAAQEYKEKLQGTLGSLRKELEEALTLMSKEEKKTTVWQMGRVCWLLQPSVFSGLHDKALQLLCSLEETVCSFSLCTHHPCSESAQCLGQTLELGG
ncbi:E3 ubiquitin-protein ligase TRIM41-like [Mauremys mutica]|uniref:E3 ubiquitin-protein ligase TRIM41-like n=1 Tax=Mauremys mutica TaxID=74926 RepID=UPI001D15FEB8|nr:E3 ubiquitin-protein ligase TRIM41-like [Mauremys mutica]